MTTDDPRPVPAGPLHETHVCRDCGAAITVPYARHEAVPAGDERERLAALLADAAHDWQAHFEELRKKRVGWPQHYADRLLRAGASLSPGEDRLREALLMFGHEYEVDGRMEWHSLNCTYRKTWAMYDEDDHARFDDAACIAARAALAGEAP